MSETTIKSYSHKGNSIQVIQTNDAGYARDCFDGSDREFADVIAECDQLTIYYIVSSGLSGCYMADNVSVYGSRKLALSAAQDEYERWLDEDDEEIETVEA